MLRNVLASRFWSWSLEKILKLNFGQDFEAVFEEIFSQDIEAEIWSRIWSWNFVNAGILKLGFCRDLRLKFGQNFESEILRLEFDLDFETEV